MSEQDSYDVAIVGAGLVGLSLACLLARSAECSALRIALVDADTVEAPPDLVDFDPRVVALSPQSQSILTEAGVWHEASLMRACAYRSMHVWDAEGTGYIDFSSQDIHKPYLGHIVENKVLLASLNQQLAGHACIEQIRGASVESLDLNTGQRHDDRSQYAPNQDVHSQVPVLRLSDGVVLKAKLIVGADGALSTLRGLADFKTKEWDYQHSAIVTTVRLEKSHQFCAWQRFSSDGPLAFLPLSRTGDDSDMASIVWSLKPELAEHYMSIDDEAFKLELARHFEQRLGRILEVDARKMIPLRQRHATRYTKPGIALVGDAAHTIHPLAGQGVNLGLYDVSALACEIKRACRRQVPLSDVATLRRYERARQGHNLAAMTMMEAFKRVFGSDLLALRWLRNRALAFVDNQFLLKKLFTELAVGNMR